MFAIYLVTNTHLIYYIGLLDLCVISIILVNNNQHIVR